MFISLKLPDIHNNSPEKIEKQFEETRSNYLKDLNKLRKKYQRAFDSLAIQYDSACVLEK